MHNKCLGLEISFLGIHTPNLVVLEACQCHIDGNFPVVPGAVSVIASCLIATSTLIWLYCFVSWRRMASRYDHTENREALKAYMKHFTEGNVDAIMELLVSASLKPPKFFIPQDPSLKYVSTSQPKHDGKWTVFTINRCTFNDTLLCIHPGSKCWF